MKISPTSPGGSSLPSSSRIRISVLCPTPQLPGCETQSTPRIEREPDALRGAVRHEQVFRSDEVVPGLHHPVRAGGPALHDVDDAREIAFADALDASDASEHRRHRGEAGDAVALDEVDGLGGVELLHQDHEVPREQRRVRERETVRVVQRRGDELRHVLGQLEEARRRAEGPRPERPYRAAG